MNYRIAAALLVGAHLVFSASAPRLCAAQNLGNIMPLGASITEGYGAPGGYRAPLYTDLTNAGYTFTYVGSNFSNPGTLPVSEQHMEGHSGFVIQARDPGDLNPAGSGRAGVADNLAAWMGPGAAKPDIILMLVGTNDVDLNYYPADAERRFSNLVSQISNRRTGLRPNARLIISDLPPIGNPVEDRRVVAFNAEVADVVAQHEALGENVSLVDMHGALNVATDMTDALHPNAQGYEKMANVWAQGIESMTFTAVPEPSACTASAGAALFMLGRRRRRK